MIQIITKPFRWFFKLEAASGLVLLFAAIIAKAVKKTFNDNGTLLPNNESTPKENAISVADGIAQPFIVSLSPKLIKT